MKELLSIVNLTKALSLLPSVGQKSAERMAYAIIEMDEEKINFLVDSIINIKKKIHHCPNCFSLIDSEFCPYCLKRKDPSICLVCSYPKDVIMFENMDFFNGTYHVLNGEINSLKGITINDLTIDKLIYRIKKENIKEIILATNPTLEGETTALYIAKILENYPVKVSRLAHGIPMGLNLEYSDKLTLTKALENRTDITKED